MFVVKPAEVVDNGRGRDSELPGDRPLAESAPLEFSQVVVVQGHEHMFAYVSDANRRADGEYRAVPHLYSATEA